MIVNCASLRGSNHIDCQKPCQDSSGYWTDGSRSIIAVSDGHGEPKCSKSDRGSKFAVQVSIDLLSRMVSEKSFLRNIKENKESFMNDIKERLISGWRCVVDQDIFEDDFEEVLINRLQYFVDTNGKIIEEKINGDIDILERIKKDLEKKKELIAKTSSEKRQKEFKNQIKNAIWSLKLIKSIKDSGKLKDDICKKIDELAEKVDNFDFEIGNNTREQYGATLLVAIYLNEYIIGFQIGDGGIYEAHSDGRIDLALELDSGCSGAVTTSLCYDDLMPHFHSFCSSRKDIVALLVCTDGFTTCHDHIKIQCSIRDIISKMDVAGKWYSDTILFLSELTRKVNKDDVSVSVCSDEKVNYDLYETLCTGRIPELAHGSLTGTKGTSMSRNDCSTINGKIMEKGTYFDGGIYLDGSFENGLFKEGTVWYPYPDQDIVSSGIKIPQERGIFFKMKNGELTQDKSR